MTAVEKPLLLLDIGGVLTPYGAKPPPEYAERQIGGFWIVWSDAHIGRISKLRPAFELVWATTWEHHANQALAPTLGTGPLPYITFVRGKSKTRKLQSVSEFVGRRAAAWIDDDLYDDAHSWAAERNESIPTLLIQTTPSVGFTDDHVDELLSFAEGQRSARST